MNVSLFVGIFFVNLIVNFFSLVQIAILVLSGLHLTTLVDFDWGSFLGGLLGAIVIVITVYWTIKSTHHDTNITIKESNRPVLIYTVVDSNYIYGSQKKKVEQTAQEFLDKPELLDGLSDEETKLLELIASPQPLLQVKNGGKGIALNITYCESVNESFALTARNSLEVQAPAHLVEIKSKPSQASDNGQIFTNFMIQYQDIYGDYYVQMIGIQYNRNTKINNNGTFAQIFGILPSFRIGFMTAPVITNPIDFSDAFKLKEALLLCDKQPTFYTDTSDIYQQYIERFNDGYSKS